MEGNAKIKSIILKCTMRTMVWRCELDSSGLILDPVPPSAGCLFHADMTDHPRSLRCVKSPWKFRIVQTYICYWFPMFFKILYMFIYPYLKWWFTVSIARLFSCREITARITHNKVLHIQKGSDIVLYACWYPVAGKHVFLYYATRSLHYIDGRVIISLFHFLLYDWHSL